MSLQNITTVSISLETTGVSRAGFGTPIFISPNRWIHGRTATYSSLTEAAEDITDTNSKEYKAMQQFFSQTPAPSQVKLGRREASVVITPDAPANGEVFTITLKDNLGNELVASYTAGSGQDQEDVVDGLKADMDADSDIAAVVTATKTGTGASAILTLTPQAAGDTFVIADPSENLTIAYTTTETATAVMSAITAEDDDFYFVTSSAHDETFVLAMAADVEARTKMYFVSIGTAGSYGALADPATDILGKLYELGYFRTVSMYHQTADTTYPECAFVGRGAPYEPGTITWANKTLAGVAAGQNLTSGNKLSSTELNNIVARNANVVTTVGGVNIVREGKTVGGEWIDIIHSRDLLVARITEAYQAKIINSGKIPYTDAGINIMRSVLESTLNRYVSTTSSPNILQETNPFTTTFPKAASVSADVKATRVLNGSFVAYLAGAIHAVAITGVLTLETE